MWKWLRNVFHVWDICWVSVFRRFVGIDGQVMLIARFVISSNPPWKPTIETVSAKAFQSCCPTTRKKNLHKLIYIISASKLMTRGKSIQNFSGVVQMLDVCFLRFARTAYSCQSNKMFFAFTDQAVLHNIIQTPKAIQ